MVTTGFDESKGRAGNMGNANVSLTGVGGLEDEEESVRWSSETGCCSCCARSVVEAEKSFWRLTENLRENADLEVRVLNVEGLGDEGLAAFSKAADDLLAILRVLRVLLVRLRALELSGTIFGREGFAAFLIELNARANMPLPFVMGRCEDC